ncbi:unnamed protein product [Didymodactylos carnosus]|uniref:P-type domain-containing protein n=1 Tax=Didymodactylos carnosus TaxID=1234261 RepID=A0A813SQS2_9BILA|nr:unnamed protein product [Didymodactylos carnosus]CAF0926235.1 unnamed protein product [Didymodactylos carnosus]CAF3584764.1 unnamed protein product [Didymodactylos carnosus]CAF3703274.1 unnamed protein product [Didymodactylos carnosus]
MIANQFSIYLLLLLFYISYVQSQTCDFSSDESRFDCFPESNVTADSCLNRGCCWRLPQNSSVKNSFLDIGVPYCYYPKNFSTYSLISKEATSFGLRLIINKTQKAYIPNEILELTVDLIYETSTRFRLRIYDSKVKRYEVPLNVPNVSTRVDNTDYDVGIKDIPFSIRVTRKSNGAVLFDSSVAPIIYADQFIKFSSSLSSPYGEHQSSLLINITSDWRKMTFWTRDFPPIQNFNLYGVHPFHMNIETGATNDFHGQFLLNSNAMDINLQPLPAITYTTIGGIIDLYIFTGPSAADVISQYWDVIGKPTMPPYWSLGFHLCRYGYNSIDKLRTVIQRMKDAQFPYDVQWTDIDAMDSRLDFTYDKVNYNGLPELVRFLQSQGMFYVNIIDPGISSTQQTGTYLPYDNGLKYRIFITKYNSSDPVIGRVWPGAVAFPDFTNPAAQEWWTEIVATFHEIIPFDGLWIDMNEPSNFVDGSEEGCTSSPLDNPPFTPINALKKIRNKRPFILSRSTFAGSGKYAFHWTGDNRATWDDMYFSIPSIINFNMFGIPLIGPDICGFGLDTTEELCTRWMQLGAFYPFMRNHNDLGQKDQDPAAFSWESQQIMKQALLTRYSLLPFWYTLFHKANATSSTVIQPLVFEFPNDKNTFGIDEQYLIGRAILVSPVLESQKTILTAYIPDDVWYEFPSGYKLSSSGTYVNLDAPLEKINLHLRGGFIIPMQAPGPNLIIGRKNPLQLIISLSSTATASGSLFYDDGDSLNVLETKMYSYFEFSLAMNVLSINGIVTNYQNMPPLDIVKFLGVMKQPTSVMVNGKPYSSILYNIPDQILLVYGLDLDLFAKQNQTIEWID